MQVINSESTDAVLSFFLVRDFYFNLFILVDLSSSEIKKQTSQEKTNQNESVPYLFVTRI